MAPSGASVQLLPHFLSGVIATPYVILSDGRPIRTSIDTGTDCRLGSLLRLLIDDLLARELTIGFADLRCFYVGCTQISGESHVFAAPR